MATLNIQDFGAKGDGVTKDTAAIQDAIDKYTQLGGGYVFNPVHNIQHGTPPENIVAAYDTAKELGIYPIKS